MTDYGSTGREGSGNPSRIAVLQSIMDTPQDSSPVTDATYLLQSQTTKLPGCLGMRHLIALLGFLGFANVYSMRVNLSVAIVAMVNSSAIPHVNSSSSNVCPAPPGNSSHGAEGEGEFAWPEALQGTILGSFFWGYILTNLLGGRLAELFGGQWVMGVGVLGTALLTLLSPVVARWNTTAFIVLRVLEGMTEGVTFPAMSSLLSRWIPPLERSQTVAMVYAGSIFGTVVSLPLSGYLCSSTFMGGWPSVFYLFGGVGVVWFFAWMLMASDGPECHRWISEEEKLYITNTLHSTDNPFKALPIPWRKIFTSLPFYAILVAHVCQNWCFYTMLTEMPTYLDNILHFNIKKNSLLSALPYFVMWLTTLASGFIADKLRSTGTLSTTTVRKLFNSFGSLGPAVCLILVGFTGCHATLSVAMLVLAVGMNGAMMAGYNASHLDIAPNFAGTLMGLTNTAATVPGFLAPMVVGQLVNGNETLGQWRLVFGIAAVVVVFGNIIYVILYNSDPLPWNEPQLSEPAIDEGPSNSNQSSRRSSPSSAE